MTPAEIRALSRLLDRMDYYRLLRVENGAPSNQIRSAYHSARRQFHPDSFINAEPALRIAVDEIAKRITEAYMVLRNQSRRRAYDEALNSGAKRFTAAAEDAVRQSEYAARGLTANGRRFYALAEDEEREENVPAAITHLKTALTFEPKNAAFKEHLETLQKKPK